MAQQLVVLTMLMQGQDIFTRRTLAAKVMQAAATETRNLLGQIEEVQNG